MIEIRGSQTTRSAEGASIEASDLMIGTGGAAWPEAVSLDGKVLHFNRDLYSGSYEDRELAGAIYGANAELTIWND